MTRVSLASAEQPLHQAWKTFGAERSEHYLTNTMRLSKPRSEANAAIGQLLVITNNPVPETGDGSKSSTGCSCKQEAAQTMNKRISTTSCAYSFLSSDFGFKDLCNHVLWRVTSHFAVQTVVARSLRAMASSSDFPLCGWLYKLKSKPAMIGGLWTKR